MTAAIGPDYTLLLQRSVAKKGHLQRRFLWVLDTLVVMSTFYCLQNLQKPADLFILNNPAAFEFGEDEWLELEPDPATTGAYLIDTPGCKIPAMAARSPEVHSFLYDYETLTCGDPPPLVDSDDETVFVVKDAMAAYNVTGEQLSCCYTGMWRLQPQLDVPEWRPGVAIDPAASSFAPLFDGKLYGNDIRFAEQCVPFSEAVPVAYEFIHVECRARGRVVYQDYHAFVPLKAPYAAGGAGRNNSDAADASDDHSLSIALVGVDAVSRLNFLRTMPGTAALLADTLRASSVLGYNKVEDNTFPNLAAMLSGLSKRELERTCWPRPDAHFDACPWIWRNFSQHGYVNAFAEDAAWMGIFHYLKKGFVNQPTEYDARPLMYLSEKNLGRGKGGNARVCVGQRFQIEVLLQYALKFIRKMDSSRRKFFGVFWGASLSHDYLNQPDEADALYLNFLNELIETGALNRTALVFMSDHGLRWGDILTTYQGHLEERLPFLHIVVPDWFRLRYPTAMRNLKANSRGRLITVFDLHRTLHSFMDLRTLEDSQLQDSAAAVQAAFGLGTPPRGISLFVPVPAERTCLDADVPTHYCACQHLSRVAVGDSAVQEVARFVVAHMNALLQREPECEQLALMDVHDAWLGQPLAHLNATHEERKFREYEYQVTLRTAPGLGLFSATVRHNLGTNVTMIAGSVTRLNAYGKRSWCTTDPAVKLFCTCRSLRPSSDCATGT